MWDRKTSFQLNRLSSERVNSCHWNLDHFSSSLMQSFSSKLMSLWSLLCIFARFTFFHSPSSPLRCLLPANYHTLCIPSIAGSMHQHSSPLIVKEREREKERRMKVLFQQASSLLLHICQSLEEEREDESNFLSILDAQASLLLTTLMHFVKDDDELCIDDLFEINVQFNSLVHLRWWI